MTDREYMALLTALVLLGVLGLWGAIVFTLHEIRRAAKLLVSRTELLEAHVRAENPELFKDEK